MAIRGQKPRPRGLKVIRGEAEEGEHREPPARSVSDLPPDLPDELVGAWNLLAPKLADQRVLTEIDTEAAVQLLFARHFALEAGRTLLAEGTVIAGTKGDRKHPAWQIYRDAQMSLRQWFCEFGMTPSARTRIPSGVDPESSDLEDLLEGRG